MLVSVTFSSTVLSGLRSDRSCLRYPILALGTIRTSSPSRINLIRVVLPEPFSPSSTVRESRKSRNVAFLKTSFPFGYEKDSCSASIIIGFLGGSVRLKIGLIWGSSRGFSLISICSIRFFIFSALRSMLFALPLGLRVGAENSIAFASLEERPRGFFAAFFACSFFFL